MSTSSSLRSVSDGVCTRGPTQNTGRWASINSWEVATGNETVGRPRAFDKSEYVGPLQSCCDQFWLQADGVTASTVNVPPYSSVGFHWKIRPGWRVTDFHWRNEDLAVTPTDFDVITAFYRGTPTQRYQWNNASEGINTTVPFILPLQRYHEAF